MLQSSGSEFLLIDKFYLYNLFLNKKHAGTHCCVFLNKVNRPHIMNFSIQIEFLWNPLFCL